MNYRAVRAFLVATLLGPVLALSVHGLAAQEAAQPRKGQSDVSGARTGLVIKRTVRRVILDVVVTDPNGKPVQGLKQQDFKVEEDSKPQRVLSFDVHDFDPLLDFDPKVPTLEPGTFVNVPAEQERGPLYVILYDLVNMEPDDQPYARKQLLNFIQAKPKGSRFAIFVLSDGLHLVQGFTTDNAQLREVMDPKSPRPHIPQIFLYGKNFGRGDSGFMVDVFNYIARFLDGMPGRKNLIWMSSGFPMTLFPSDDDGQSYREKIKQTLDTLARGQVAVYPVDVRGPVVDEARAPKGAAPSGGTYTDYRTGGSGTTNAPASAAGAGGAGYSLLASAYMTENEVAEVTGGHAFFSTNDLAGALSRATETGASYYTLTYSPSNQKYDGKLRTIHLSLAKKGYTLAYRRSYYGIDPDAPALPGKPPAAPNPQLATEPSLPEIRKSTDTLSVNLQHGAPLSHDLLFRAQLQPLGPPALATPEQMVALEEQNPKARRKAKAARSGAPVQVQTIAVNYTLLSRQVSFAGSDTASVPSTLEVAAAAYDADGKMLSSVVDDVQREDSLFTQSNVSGLYRIEQKIDVPLKATWIRVAVHDRKTDRVGALEVALPLPPATQTRTAPSGLPGSEQTAPGKPN